MVAFDALLGFDFGLDLGFDLGFDLGLDCPPPRALLDSFLCESLPISFSTTQKKVDKHLDAFGGESEEPTLGQLGERVVHL